MDIEDIGMDISVENVSFLPKSKRVIIKPSKKAMQEYRDAYKKVYGVFPEIALDGIWYRIKGHTGGVKLRRLREMTTQLRYRSGDDE